MRESVQGKPKAQISWDWDLRGDSSIEACRQKGRQQSTVDAPGVRQPSNVCCPKTQTGLSLNKSWEFHTGKATLVPWKAAAATGGFEP